MAKEKIPLLVLISVEFRTCVLNGAGLLKRPLVREEILDGRRCPNNIYIG